MTKSKALLLASRPKTLTAAFIPVLIAGGLAMSQNHFNFIPWLICLLFGILIQIGTNYANDVCDFEKGADDNRRIGPSRAVASGWLTVGEMKLAMVFVFGCAFFVGLSLIPFGGYGLIPIGIVSILCGYLYTGGPYPLGYNGLGDLFVFLFFGWVATGVTYYVQAGTFELAEGEKAFLQIAGVWLAGIIPGALATNLLVVNNYRDAPLDSESGKRTLIVRFGRTFGLSLYTIMFAMSLIVPVLFKIGGYGNVILLPLLLLPLMVFSIVKLKGAETRQMFDRVLGLTALILLSYGSLFALALALV